MMPAQRRAPLALLLALPLMANGAALAAPASAVVADLPRDAAHPAVNRQMLIPSAGLGMNAVLLQAAGAGLKPTLVLLHGLPGNEQNLDLAQAIRRAGWNVLTFHYRGSWGSPGSFSIAGAVEDAAAAMAFLQQPVNAARYGVDTRRLLIGGHSMGGFAAARYAAAHPDVPGLILIDAWNAGAFGADLQAHPGQRTQANADMSDDLGTSLAGITGVQLVDEALRHASDWNLLALSPALADLPVLVIGATHGKGKENAALAAAIHAQHGGRLTSMTMDTDHSFADHRIALADSVVRWLRPFGATAPLE